MANMAAVIYQKGAPDVFRWEEWPVGDPGQGELRIRHGAIGVNYVDTYHRRGMPHPWPVPDLPVVLGFEGAGIVGEGSNMNMAFVTKDGVLKHPRFDNILSGCTVLRLLEIATVLVDRGIIRDIRIGDIPVEEAKGAAEMMLIGSSIFVAPVVEWDGQTIGDGKPGPVAKAMLRLLEEDMKSGEGRLIDVPY